MIAHSRKSRASW